MSDDLLLHGGALDRMRRAFPDAPEPWLDLSTGINPWPYSTDRLPCEGLHHLPTETERAACRDAMASSFGALKDAVLVVPGTELAIRLLPMLLPRVSRVAVLTPGYGDHAAAWTVAGREVSAVSDPFAVPSNCDAVVLANPNNPDGRSWRAADLAELHRHLEARGAVLIVDEAYAECAPADSLASLAGASGLVVLRSFGKFYGLAGARLGALLGPSDMLARAAGLFGCWPVGGVALWLGTRAYADTDWQTATRARLAEAALKLDETLASAGLAVQGGTTLFRYVATSDAERVWRSLAQAGIYVRRFRWSDRHLRLGLPPDAAALDRLRAALKA